MTLTITNPETFKTQIGWCRRHEGMHERRDDCSDYGYSEPLVGCDVHGKKPHRQSETCVNPAQRKADPFHGF